MSKIRVAVTGYGVIGRRVVDAVALQEDGNAERGRSGVMEELWKK